MTAKEKREFIRSLCNTVKKELVGKVKDMPAEWDGKELRWYIAERFSLVVFSADRKRSRKYNNDCLINNL